MNQTHQGKFNCGNSISIERPDDFSLNKSATKPESHKELILFSDFINRNASFPKKLLLNTFPELVEAVLQEEFGRNLDSELICILIRDFNMKAFGNFKTLSTMQNSISNEIKAPIRILEGKEFDKANMNPATLLRYFSYNIITFKSVFYSLIYY